VGPRPRDPSSAQSVVSPAWRVSGRAEDRKRRRQDAGDRDHQARDLLAAPDADTVKSKRDRPILWPAINQSNSMRIAARAA
jgi:hypothetical protein